MHISRVHEHGAHMAVTSLHRLLVVVCDGNIRIDDSRLEMEEPEGRERRKFGVKESSGESNLGHSIPNKQKK
jgi:hypothetical protein